MFTNELIVFFFSEPTDNKADWTRAMSQIKQVASVPLKRWHIITSTRNSGDARNFLQGLRRVSAGLSFDLAEPRM